MATVRPLRVTNQPVPIHTQALANLRYIRRTMENAGQFTAVPGRGGVVMGMTALLAASAAHFLAGKSGPLWLSIWSGEALLGMLIAFVFAQRKSMAMNKPLLKGPGRKFLLALLPAIFVASLLTVMLWRSGLLELAPGVWLLLYGCGILAGGAYSAPPVPVMGTCFLLVGALALFTPAAWGDAWLAAGFGGAQVLFGVVIARNYGG